MAIAELQSLLAGPNRHLQHVAEEKIVSWGLRFVRNRIQDRMLARLLLMIRISVQDAEHEVRLTSDLGRLNIEDSDSVLSQCMCYLQKLNTCASWFMACIAGVCMFP